MKSLLVISLTSLTAAALTAENVWTTVEKDGRVSALLNGKTVLAWQKEPLGDAKGGPKFAGSNFFHPLATPSGFVTTERQPGDHMHHFGLWWPWKFVVVDGKRHNTWEIQQGQGAHVAGSAEILDKGPDSLKWRLSAHVETRSPDQEPRVVIRETTDLTLSSLDAQSIAIDMDIKQTAIDAKVVIGRNHYSGLGFRGIPEWNDKTSRLITSEGMDREDGNGTPIRWVLVTGDRPGGKASVLLMSAAATTSDPERVRVWNAKMHSGHHFVNINPVAEKDLPLNDDHPAVSARRYRIITSDRELDADEAEKLWKSWLGR